MKATLLLGLSVFVATTAMAQTSPTPLQDLTYDIEFFPETNYDPAVPTVQSLLGFRPGDRAAFPDEVGEVLKAWGETSPRVTVIEYARSHENRALYYAIITSAENHARLNEIKTGLSRLADPRGLSNSEAD